MPRVTRWAALCVASIGIAISCILGTWTILERETTNPKIKILLIVTGSIVSIVLIFLNYFKERKSELERDRKSTEQKRKIVQMQGALNRLEKKNDTQIDQNANLRGQNKELKRRLVDLSGRELLENINVQIDAFDCTQRLGSNDLISLYRTVCERELAANQIVEMLVHIHIAPLDLYLYGARIDQREEWYFWIGEEGVHASTEFTKHKPTVLLVDFTIDSGMLGKHLAVGHRIRDFVERRPSSERSWFDPSWEMGFFKIVSFRTARLSETEPHPASEFIIPLPDNPAIKWKDLSLQDEVVSQWATTVKLNGSYEYVNIMRPDGFSQVGPEVADRFGNWDIPEKYRLEGRIYLAPRPWNWRNLAPLMTPNVRYLLYEDDCSQDKQY